MDFRKATLWLHCHIFQKTSPPYWITLMYGNFFGDISPLNVSKNIALPPMPSTALICCVNHIVRWLTAEFQTESHRVPRFRNDYTFKENWFHKYLKNPMRGLWEGPCRWRLKCSRTKERKSTMGSRGWHPNIYLIFVHHVLHCKVAKHFSKHTHRSQVSRRYLIPPERFGRHMLMYWQMSFHPQHLFIYFFQFFSSSPSSCPPSGSGAL